MAESDNVKKFLDFLGRAEGAEYDTIVGSTQRNPKKFSDFSKHPGVVGLVTKDGPSTAAGKYQITKTTYDDFAKRLGITDFSPQSQDRIALAIIQKEGALDDVKAGRYDQAIAKLGGRWASLPSSPYRQSKRTPEWVAKELTNPTPVPTPNLQGTITDPSTLVPTQSVSQSSLLMDDLRKEEKYGGIVNSITQIPEAISYGFQNENNAYNFFVEQGAAKADPSFTLTKEKFQAAYEGLPEDHKGYLAQAVSDDDLARRRGRVEAAVNRQAELGKMGAVGFAGTIAGTLLDVDTLLSVVPILGEGTMLYKGGRIANAVKTGLATAATTAGSEYVFGQYRPTATDSDIYWAGLFGLGLGGAVGGLKKPFTGAADDAAATKEALARWAQKEAGKIQQQELKEAGLNTTVAGKKVLDPELRDDPLVDVDTLATRDEATPIFERTTRGVDSQPTIGQGANRRPREAKSAATALDDIITAGTPEEKLFASRLKEQIADDVNVYEVPKKDLYQGSRPYYDPNNHAIYVAKGTSPSVRLHEIAHAVTVHKLDFGLKNLESAHGKLSSEIKQLHKLAQAEAKKQGFKSYYLKDIYEFTAGLYGGGASREKFVDFMSKIKVDEGDTILSKFVDAVRKILGMDGKETNAFLKSLNLTDKLIDTKLNVTLRNASSLGDTNMRYPAGSKSFRLAEGEDADMYPDPKSVPEGYWQGPAYENFFNREWVPNEVKSFVRKIFGSTTGYKDHSVVEQSAMDQKRALAGQWTNQFAKSVQPAIREFLEDMKVPYLKKTEALEQWNESLGDYIRGVPGNYHPTVKRVGDEWRRLSKDVVDHINNPGKFNGDVKRGLTQREIADDQGNTTLTDPLGYNDNYLPRIPDTYKIANMISQFGRETVETFIGKMFKSANNDLDEDMVPKLGKWYLATIEEAKVNRASDLIDNQLRGFDDVGFKDSLMKVAGVTSDQADRIIAGMRPKKGSDAGMLNGNLKRRSLLDETYTQKLVMKNGDTHEMSYKDLFDTDTVGNINQYFTKQAGAISLANHTGMYNVKDVKKAIAEMTGREFGDQVNDEQLAKMRKHLQDILDQTLSRPLEDFSTFNKSLQMVADYNVLTKAGLFVLNQITELSQIMGSPMYRSVLRSVPELNNLIRDAKTGKVNNETIDALENLSGGPGTQLLRDNPLTPTRTWVREKGDTKFNQWLDSADNTLKRGTHNLFKFTGMTGVTMMQQRMVATAFVNHMVDHAVNGKNIGYSVDRLAWMGLSSADTKAVMEGIRTYHKAGEGKLGTVDFNTWAKEDPKSFSKFIVAYQRESARIVQENDLASMVPIMGRSVGQVLFQFMGFPLQAWNKSMLFAANHMDTHTLNTVMYAVGMNMLMYTARVQMTMAGMSDTEKQKYAQERLSSEKIILNAVGRIPQLSVLPNMFDTVSPVPLFSGMRTSTDLTDFVSGNPTISTISGFLNMGKKVVRNSASDEYQTTEKDVRTWMRLAPLNNVMGVSNILNSVAADYPSQEKQTNE
jgi:muramidase (phage lysozyme)